jgi:hypothetical protein
LFFLSIFCAKTNLTNLSFGLLLVELQFIDGEAFDALIAPSGALISIYADIFLGLCKYPLSAVVGEVVKGWNDYY